MIDLQNIAIEAARAALAPRGLDLVRPFSLAAYNEAIAEVPALLPLPTFGRASSLGLLIGNTRALWAPFLAARRADPALRESEDPLDRYVERAVEEAAARIGARIAEGIGAPTFLRFGHAGGAGLVSMLRLAEVSGLASVGPAHLAVHPLHGPWFALRAVIGVDLPAPAALSPMSPPAPPRSPCEGCAAPCVEAMDRALAQAELDRERAGRDLRRAQVIASWRDWLAVRDACPVGAEGRYPEAQIRYHYARDLEALEDGGQEGGR